MTPHTARRRGLAATVVVASVIVLAGCGTSDSSAGPDSAPSTVVSSSDVGIDPASQTFGTGCSQMPTDPNNPGSFQGMSHDPVATASSHNPILTQLVAAVDAVPGLSEQLDDAHALTLFAPDDDAFAALPPRRLHRLLLGAVGRGGDSPLAMMLSDHVVATGLDREAVAGSHTTLDGRRLTVTGNSVDGMTVSDGTVTARVLCGNIATANARVYVIDKVLTEAL